MVVAFYTKDYDAEHSRDHTKNRRCGALMQWWQRLKADVTAWWIRVGDVQFTHVELMFSDDSVVSATELGGVHYDQDRKLSNTGYTDFLAVEVTYTQQVLMKNFVAEKAGLPFNSAGRLWNSVGLLRGCCGVVDTEGRAYYCSELITTMLQQADLCQGLDPRCTNPTQLYLYLKHSGQGKPYYNAKETRLTMGTGNTAAPGERYRRMLVGEYG
jgi:hypothetical protein